MPQLFAIAIFPLFDSVRRHRIENVDAGLNKLLLGQSFEGRVPVFHVGFLDEVVLDIKRERDLGRFRRVEVVD